MHVRVSSFRLALKKLLVSVLPPAISTGGSTRTFHNNQLPDQMIGLQKEIASTKLRLSVVEREMAELERSIRDLKIQALFHRIKYLSRSTRAKARSAGRGELYAPSCDLNQAVRQLEVRFRWRFMPWLTGSSCYLMCERPSRIRSHFKTGFKQNLLVLVEPSRFVNTIVAVNKI